MTLLMRGRDLVKRPVVSLGGEDLAQVRDVVYEAAGGRVAGFTLAGRGVFSGPLKQGLPWSGVHALGADAVMVADADALGRGGELGGGGGDVLGDAVITDDGTILGEVCDVILSVGRDEADVVGYEVEASAALGNAGQRVLIPLPDTLAASGEALVVPAAAAEFVSADLAGFGAAVEAFRNQLRES